MSRDKNSHAAYMRQWHAAHPGRNTASVKRWRKKLKAKVFAVYGGAKCACCGEDHIEFVSLDHINGGGNKAQREEGHRGGHSLYRLLRRQEFPPGYRVLCMNCNFALGQVGYCPHQVTG